MHAGVGYGGSCLPKDIQRAQTPGKVHRDSKRALLRAVATVNSRQRRLPLDLLNSRFHGCLEGLQIGVLGLAFKPGTDDVRDSPSLELIRELAARGASVSAFDPRATAPVSRKPAPT